MTRHPPRRQRPDRASAAEGSGVLDAWAAKFMIDLPSADRSWFFRAEFLMRVLAAGEGDWRN